MEGEDIISFLIASIVLAGSRAHHPVIRRSIYETQKRVEGKISKLDLNLTKRGREPREREQKEERVGNIHKVILYALFIQFPKVGPPQIDESISKLEYQRCIRILYSQSTLYQLLSLYSGW